MLKSTSPAAPSLLGHGQYFFSTARTRAAPHPRGHGAACCALLLVLAGGAFGAWEPEIEAKGRSWNALIEQELDRSMALYERPASLDAAEALLLEILGDPYRLVLVVGNRLVVDRRLLLQKKGMHHIEFLNEDQLVREGCPTPANMRLNRVKPKSKLRQKDATPLPRLVIAKRYGYDQCGILVPNCYFDDLTKWGRLAETITDPDCDDEAGNFARTEAVALTAAHPDVFDVKCLECDVRDEARQFRPARDERATRPTSKAPISPVFQSFRLMFGRAIIPRNGLDAWMGFPGTRASKRRRISRFPRRFCPRHVFADETKRHLGDLRKLGASHVDKSSFGRYQFQLNLPGSVSGSYSRNLNHLWLLGSVIAMWDAPYVEWYYPALAEGVTHLALNRSTALDAVRDVPRRAVETMLRNARAVYDRLLCPDCLAAYMRTLVRKMRAYFRLGDVLDDPARLRRVLERLDVASLELLLELAAHTNDTAVEAKLNDAKPWRQRRRGDKGGTFTLGGGAGPSRAARGRGLAESD
ncbi:hypothetical protein JL722_6730 [Aureococcus anophagefferens]|nr:hypothetical protein JL722_6730 [Aureococcus anophagefferens]